MPERPVTTGDGALGIGFHGKSPTLGDFITRRLDRPVVQRWEGWVQEALACSREQLGPDWLDNYLTSPVWRFALGSGVLGERAYAGLLMPSVDRVGRYYPFVLFAAVEPTVTPVRLTLHAEPWYAKAESLILSVLDDSFDVETFDRALRDLGAPAAAPSVDQNLRLRVGMGPMIGAGLRLAVEVPPGVVSAYQAAIEDQFAERRRYGLWWTSGSERVAPSLLVTEGLPHIGSFAALLDGDWQRWNWEAGEPRAAAQDSSPLRAVSP